MFVGTHLGRRIDTAPQNIDQSVPAFLAWGWLSGTRPTWIACPNNAAYAWQVDPVLDNNLSTRMHDHDHLTPAACLDPLNELLPMMIQTEMFSVPAFDEE